MKDIITEEQFNASLPKALKKGIPKDVLDDINAMINDGEEGKVFKENFLSHNQLLMEGKFTLQQYVNAVKFVSYRLLDNSQRRAYELTFPVKVTEWLANGTEEKSISAYVHAYNNSKLVMRLYEVTLVPFHLLHQPYRQEALLKQVTLMRGGFDDDTGKPISHMVQHLAAKSVLEILTPPESAKTELTLKVKESAETGELKLALANLARAQKENLERGGSLKSVAESTLVEIVDEDDDVLDGELLE